MSARAYVRSSSITNPYQIPESVSSPAEQKSPSVSRLKIAAWLLLYLYPLCLAGSFYAAWIVAWLVLGHPPRPMLDDPKSIGGVMVVVYLIPGLLLVAMPALAPLGLAASFFCPICPRGRLRWLQKTALAILYIALCAIVLLMLRADPGRVVEWWFD